MKIVLNATEKVDILVEEQRIPIQHYLRQPQRLVNAIANPQLTEHLSEDNYLIKMYPLDVFMYHFQPVVTLKVWANHDGLVHLESRDCEIRGNKYIDEHFSLSLTGQLAPTQVLGKTVLKGIADLQVIIDLPPGLEMTPRPFLETTGKSLMKGVLQRIATRISSQLITDYRHWANKASSDQAYSRLSPAENLTN